MLTSAMRSSWRAFLIAATSLFASLPSYAVAPPAAADRPSQTAPGQPGAQANRRIEWDQSAPSRAVLDRYQFRLSVDGVAQPLTAVRCAPADTPADYVCSALLPELPPGSRALTVTAIAGPYESVESLPLQVVAALAAGVSPPTMPLTPLCFSDVPASCFTVRHIADTAGRLSSPITVADGRVFVIEGGQRIRVIAGDALLAVAALNVAPAAERIAALAADAAAPQTGAVYMLTVLRSAERAVAASVSRLREVQNRFGEAATLVPSIELASGDDAAPPSTPLLAYGGDFIYTAVTGGSDRRTSAGVLRFTRDGGTPWQAGQTSPAFARGVTRPTAIAFDGKSRRLWLAGSDVNRRSIVQGIQTDRPADVRVLPLGAARGDAHVVGLAIEESAARGRRLVSIDSTGVLRRMPIDDARIGTAQELPFPFGTPAGIAAAGGVLYVITDVPGAAGAAAAGGSSIYSLTPRPGPAR